MYADLYNITPQTVNDSTRARDQASGRAFARSAQTAPHKIPRTLGAARELVSRVYGENSHITHMYENCVSDTLTQTISRQNDGSYFMITGDIPAMWLRDSACQLHFLIPFASEDTELAAVIRGIIARQMRCILIDPYANAFNAAPTGSGEWADDLTNMRPELWERKYEIDSLCYPVQLSYLYYRSTADETIFTKEWFQAARMILQTFETETYHESRSSYRFQRLGCRYQDTLSRDGRGALVKEGIGLIWSGFRPSDDACVYGYLIPSNMFAVVILEYIAEIAAQYDGQQDLATNAGSLAASVRAAIKAYAVMPNVKEPYYAYEVDGFGQYLVMDDANVPSLLAMPYLGYCKADDPLYRRTRQVLLSDANPYYYAGARLSGIGSVHTEPGWIWPIALAIQGLTSTDPAEQLALIQMIAENDAGTGLVHESIHKDDPTQFTRPWFSWANMMFCELVLEYAYNSQ